MKTILVVIITMLLGTALIGCPSRDPDVHTYELIVLIPAAENSEDMKQVQTLLLLLSRYGWSEYDDNDDQQAGRRISFYNHTTRAKMNSLVNESGYLKKWFVAKKQN